MRSANLGDRVYVDLCDDHWRAMEIKPDGWRMIEDVPVHFRRKSGMQPLPAPSLIDPKKGIARLKEVLCLRDERDLVVIVAWELAALASRPPFTVLVFVGEPGSTKSSAAFAARSLIDPNAGPLRAKPKDLHEVFVAAVHSRIVAYNNLSHMPDWLSDGICVVTEGSSETQRELFTNADESLIVACAPFLITSIENVIRRGDLAQRTLYIHLANVSDTERITEEEFKLKFRRAHADILGALCSAVARTQNREDIEDCRPPTHGHLLQMGDSLRGSALAERRIRRCLRGKRSRRHRGRHRRRQGGLSTPFVHDRAREWNRNATRLP